MLRCRILPRYNDVWKLLLLSDITTGPSVSAPLACLWSCSVLSYIIFRECISEEDIADPVRSTFYEVFLIPHIQNACDFRVAVFFFGARTYISYLTILYCSLHWGFLYPQGVASSTSKWGMEHFPWFPPKVNSFIEFGLPLYTSVGGKKGHFYSLKTSSNYDNKNFEKHLLIEF